MALHEMAGLGGVYDRGVPGLFSLDLSCKWRSCRPEDYDSCEILQLFLRISCSFVLSFFPPLCFFSNALLTCVHLNFYSCRTPSVAFEPDCWGYHLLYFPSNQSIGLGSLWTSPVLAGSMEFSGALRQPSSFASAPQVGCMSFSSSTLGEASP